MISQSIDMQTDELVENLKAKDVDFLHFAFRWMICLLLREMPVDVVLRLWDSYLTEGNMMADFHIFVCCAFLEVFSKDIKRCEGFDTTLIFIQKIPTDQWHQIHGDFLARRAYDIRRSVNYCRRLTEAAMVYIVIAFVSSILLYYIQQSPAYMRNRDKRRENTQRKEQVVR